MSKLDNPPAFPTGVDDTEGMTLRDWFAGQALASGVSAEDFQCASGETRWQAEARYCYRLADAMLAERGKGGHPSELVEAAKAVLTSAFAANYRLISPFKELAAAIAKAEGRDQ